MSIKALNRSRTNVARSLRSSTSTPDRVIPNVKTRCNLMEDWKDEFARLFESFESYVTELLSATPVLLGEAEPPSRPGAYIIYDHNGQPSYVGEAKGSGGLQDRLLRKHLSGDDSHAIQRAYNEKFPDRATRRNYIKKNVSVCWVETADAHTAVALERILILMLKPRWNQR